MAEKRPGNESRKKYTRWDEGRMQVFSEYKNTIIWR